MDKKQLLIQAYKGRAEVYTLFLDHNNALKDYKDMKNLSKSPEIILDYLDGLAEIFYKTGQFKKAFDYSFKAEKIARQNRLDFKQLKIIIRRAEFLMNTGKYTEALKISYSILKKIKNFKNKKANYEETLSLKAACLSALGRIYYYKGDYDNSLFYYKRAMRIYKKQGNLVNISGCLNNIGLIFYNLGKYKKAIKICKESLHIAEKTGYIFGLITSWNNIGLVQDETGNYREALGSYKASLTYCKQTNLKQGIALTRSNIASIYYAIYGNLDTALKLYKKSLNIYKEIGDNYGIAECLINIGNIYEEKGNIEKAFLTLNKSEKILNELKLKELLCGFYILKCKTLLCYENKEEGVKTLKKLVKILNKIKSPVLSIEIFSCIIEMVLKNKLHIKNKKFNILRKESQNKVKHLKNPRIKSLLLKMLIKLYLGENDLKKAEKYLSDLSRIISIYGIKKYLPEAFYLSAKISYLKGKSPEKKLRKAEKISKQMKFGLLLKEIRKLRKKIKCKK